MSKIKKAAILAAGEGSRLKSICEFKPMIPICGTPLVERVMERLLSLGVEQIVVAFNSSEKKMNWDLLPSFNRPEVKIIFVDTPSSMHTLYEVLKELKPTKEDHILASMVDTIVKEQDFLYYFKNIEQLKSNESCLLVTPFIDDEKPLTVKLDEQNNIKSFNCPIEKGTVVTSGMYGLSGIIFAHLETELAAGTHKMRNFLSSLIPTGHTLKGFVVEKTLDIDRPEDVKVAENFLCQI